MSSSSDININETITNIVGVYKKFNPSYKQTDPELTRAALNWAIMNAKPTLGIKSELSKGIKGSIIMNDTSDKTSLTGDKIVQILNSLLSSFGLGDTTSSKQTTKINDEQIIFPEHYTGVLTINLTILENPDEPEKQTKAMDAIAQILNHEIYGLDILIDKLLFKDIFQANRIVEEKDIVEDIVQDFGEELI